jgi:hypothetical protein
VGILMFVNVTAFLVFGVLVFSIVTPSGPTTNRWGKG